MEREIFLNWVFFKTGKLINNLCERNLIKNLLKNICLRKKISLIEFLKYSKNTVDFKIARSEISIKNQGRVFTFFGALPNKGCIRRRSNKDLSILNCE